MATLVLTTAATAIGGAFPASPLVGLLAGTAARTVGGIVDNRLLGASLTLKPTQGPMLADLGVQTSTYGKMIPIVYGTVRIAGNMIWSRPIDETATTSTAKAGGKGGGGRVTQTSTTYSYSVSMAIAICEGPVDDILRVWADAKLLDLSQGTYRFYKGDESQVADSFIESFEGAGATPAYRGLAYVVIENFPLADYGNRIPNFTFEIRKRASYADYDGQTTEEMVKAVIMIPGSGEFVYDTQVEYKVPGEQVGADWAQNGSQEAINSHNHDGVADALTSLDDLQGTLPNVEWVGVVVNWFGDSLDAGACVVKPGVEYQSGATTSPGVWTVGGFTRDTARQITLVGDAPRYGGTPDDASLLRYLAELRSRGYNIMFYPVLLMDIDGKPWRGELTGSASDVASFFTKTNGYNAFINHYASLVAGSVDAFIIGSELVGLTKVTPVAGTYPGVSALVSLAAGVKSTLGSSVKITYGADWSEYHHDAVGYYNLDPLWASPNIDVVGIDAYFPLTGAPQAGYDLQPVIDGWTSGEGWDFYYTDVGRTTTASLTPPFAWKNIDWWYNHTHTNPGGGSTTAWTPAMKKIWFTEYGFPSTDGATNQPNVFYDPSSAGSAFPYFSKGRVDVRAQRQGITATEAQWGGSAMVERRFLWSWDARPFPYWPDLNGVWGDAADWAYGHWVEGKLGISNVAAIVQDLCARAGLDSSLLDVSDIAQPLEGYAITAQQTARSSIEQLMAAFFFDAVESGGALKFVSRGDAVGMTIAEDDLIPQNSGTGQPLLPITRTQEVDLPQRVQVTYLNRTSNYQLSTQLSQRMTTPSREAVKLDLPLVLADQSAKTIADVALFNAWMGRSSYAFDLPVKYAALEPADVVQVTENGVTHTMRITSTQLGGSLMKVNAIAEDASVYDFYTPPATGQGLTTGSVLLPVTTLQLLDIPAFLSDPLDQGIVRAAAAGSDSTWRGTVIYRCDDGGTNYNPWLSMDAACTMGAASTALASGPANVFDDASSVTVVLTGDVALASATQLAVLSGAGAALLGSEIIQFTTATLIEPGKYILTGLLRGRLGTEWAISMHAAGEPFILLNAALGQDTASNAAINIARSYKPVTIGDTLGHTAAQSFTYSGVALKPYAPVQVSGSRDGSLNLTIGWIRRSRGGGPWLDYADVPLNEDSEQYSIDILNGSTVVRTLTSTSPTAAYSAAQQTTDFGSPQGSVSVKIYQLSTVVGRGYAASAFV